MLSFIKSEIEKTKKIIQQLEETPTLLATVKTITEKCVASLQMGGKILFAGNGGSAADSQHLAAELVCRLSYNRPAIAAIALTTDTSVLTAIGNDYSFEDLFSRQLAAIGRQNDVFIAISTSGKSANILKALETGRAMRLQTIAFTGIYTDMMAKHSDCVLSIPTTATSKIQECHIILGHIICALIEEKMFGTRYNTQHTQTALIDG